MSDTIGYIICEDVHRQVRAGGVLGTLVPHEMGEVRFEWQGGDIAEVSDELWPWFKRKWEDGCFWPWELEYLGPIVGSTFYDAAGKPIEGTGTRHRVRRIGGAE